MNILLVSNLFSQQEETLTLKDKLRIEDEITIYTNCIDFIKHSKDCVSIINLSFNSERMNYNNSPWCNNYLAVLSNFGENSHEVIYSNITWDERDIELINYEEAKLCGIFCYKVVTNLGCTYCGRNAITAHIQKDDENKWKLALIDEITLLHPDDQIIE